MFHFFKRVNRVRLVSEPIQRVDGFYFVVKVPCVHEQITLSTRNLLSQYAPQLSKEDKAIAIKTFKMEVKYTLLSMTDKEFEIEDITTGERQLVRFKLSGVIQ